ncbi:MAG: ABC transporter ATP-binding protein [Stanieria sp.]
MVLLCLFTSLLESLGIGLVGPFIALATNLNLIFQKYWSNQLYNQLGFSSEIQFIGFLGLVIVGILYLKAFLGFKIQKYIFEFGFGQQADLRLKLLHAYLTVPYVFHLNRNTAVLIQNILTETDNFANGVLMPILFGFSNLVVILALTILLLKTNLIATASIFIILLLVASILYWFKNKLARWGKEGHESNVEMIRLINHGLGGFKETKVIGCESYFENQMVQQAGKFKIAVTNANAFSLLPRYILEPLIITFLVGFTIAYLLQNQSAETLTATLGVFGMASIRLLPAASNFISTVASVRRCSYIVDQLYFDLKELEKVEFNHNWQLSNSTLKQSFFTYSDEKVIPFKNEIILDRVTYSYPKASKSSLKNISLVIKKGESLGLMGKSGAGKTTLVDVILGLLTPESGDIKVDGISVYENLRAWQNLVGYIPQSIFLIDDTIERNIAFGVPDHLLNRRKIEEAIAAAQLTELIHELPDGLETIVGERGVRLSGGQRQRIGIARALYHQREILVLDEATSALDNDTEKLVNEAIKSLKGKKTMITIAHRLSTIKECDRIYLLDRGQIVRSGSYQEVVLK